MAVGCVQTALCDQDTVLLSHTHALWHSASQDKDYSKAC